MKLRYLRAVVGLLVRDKPLLNVGRRGVDNFLLVRHQASLLVADGSLVLSGLVDRVAAATVVTAGSSRADKGAPEADDSGTNHHSEAVEEMLAYDLWQRLKVG